MKVSFAGRVTGAASGVALLWAVAANAAYAEGTQCPDVLPEPVEVEFGLRTATLAAIGANIAIAKGYFEDVGLDVNVTEFPGAANSFIPSLATGDLDVIYSGTSASLFNAQAGGFGIQIFLPVSAHGDGFASQITLVAKPELVDSGVLDDPEQLRKLQLDGLVQGTVSAYTFETLLKQMGLEDVELGYRTPASPMDMVSLFKRGEVDVSAMLPPVDALMEQQGIAKIWKTSYEIIGDEDFGFLLGNPEFLENEHCAAVAFARAMRRAAAEIYATGGEWTPDLLAIATETADMDEETIRLTQVPYYVVSGTIDVDRLRGQLESYRKDGVIRGEIDLDEMINLSVLEALGERSPE